MGIIDDFAGIVKKVSGPGGITVDDGWDQLNRSLMFVVCLVFGFVVTIRQHAGNIIKCDGFTKFSDDFVEDYCWTQGLYTVAEAYDMSRDHVPYPGVIPRDIPKCVEMPLKNGGTIKCPKESDIKEPQLLFHLWYQWVPFYFWLVAAGFYFPYLLYKNFGMADLKPLVKLLHNPVETSEAMPATVDKAVNWLTVRFSMERKRTLFLWKVINRHGLGFTILFTKGMYVLVSFVTMALTARMFEIGNFWTYGAKWGYYKFQNGPATVGWEPSNDPTDHLRDKLFPKMIACEIRRWGTTGIETEHGTCVLAPNVINQYLFLIFWFVLVALMVTNLFSFIVSFFKLFFTYGSYRRIKMISMMKDEKRELKELWYSVGVSGRVVFMMLAGSVRPTMFEQIVKTFIRKTKNPDQKDALA